MSRLIEVRLFEGRDGVGSDGGNHDTSREYGLDLAEKSKTDVLISKSAVKPNNNYTFTDPRIEIFREVFKS